MECSIYCLLIVFLNTWCTHVESSSIPSHRVLPGSQLITDHESMNHFLGPTQFVIDQNDQINRNNPSIDSAYYIQSVCGIPLNFETNSNKNLNNFCHDSFKTRKNEGNRYLKDEPSDDERKCYSFLCAWYHEKCEVTTINNNPNHATEVVQSETRKCNCLYNLWNQCKCDVVLNVKDNFILSPSLNDPSSNTKAHIDVRFGHNAERKTSSYSVPPAHRETSSYLDMEGYQNDAPVDTNVQLRMAADDADAFVFVDEGENARPWDKPTVDPFNVNTYNEDQRKCFALKQVWFNDQCVKLKSQATCGPGEWLVLKKPAEGSDLNELQPECQQKKCTKKDEVWWDSENRCVTKSEATRNHCKGKDVLVDHDSFGDGYCTCYDDAGSFEGSYDCYEFYQKGRCKITEVVTYDKTSGYATCTKDLCFELNHPNLVRNRPKRFDENARRITKREVLIFPEYLQKRHFIEKDDEIIRKFIDPYKPDIEDELRKYDRVKRQTSNRKPSASEKKYYAPFGGNGQCYKLGPQTMCDHLGEEAQFKFHKLLKVPECFVSTSNALHLIDSRPGCKVDESNNCRQEVKLAQASELDYLLHLKNQARKKRDTRPK